MINRPNILMIMTDNQPADMLGCYGNDEVLTPHIDQLAAKPFGNPRLKMMPFITIELAHTAQMPCELAAVDEFGDGCLCQ